MIAGRYIRVRPIGRGGTGSVWLGRDEALGRSVALKRIGVLPGGSDTDLARAEREAQLAARLHHPHVVAVFDVVTDDDGDTRWLVMEHVEGQSLSELIRDEGPLPLEEASRLLGQVAEALVAAHEVGIVHRDVKPSNVLIDQRRNAKLTDFGIARSTTDPSLTQTGLVTGSPAYLAPEVASGSRGDEAVDAWSWGATLFHALAGQAPYAGGETFGTLYRVVHEPAPRLPQSGFLAPALDGTMTKDPAHRWSMRQVRDFLRDGVVPDDVPPPAVDDTATATVAVVPPPRAGAGSGATGSAARPAAGSGRRRRAALVVAALVLLAGVAAVGVRLLGDDEVTPPAATASSPSASPSASPSPSETPEAEPTAAGMEDFIRSYVTATGDDPEQSWQMLTPKFQRESGGYETYRSYWEPASNGRVTDFVAVDPETLEIAYQVRFDTWENGPGPTRLQLSFDPEDDTYRIDGETSAGFVPAG